MLVTNILKGLGVSAYLVLASVATAQITLEDYDSLTVGDSIGDETGWTVVTGSATISDAQSASGTQSVALTAGSPLSEIVRTVQASEWGSDTVAWWDLWLLPMAHAESAASYTIDADGSQIELRATQVEICEDELLSYSGGVGQDGQYGLPTTATVSTDGTSIQLEGNCWKCIPYQYTITESTVLSFEVSIEDAGEIIAISLDDDLSYNSGKLFQLGGSASMGWISDYSYSGSGFVTMSIAVGQYYTGAAEYILVLADDDADGLADVTFRNIRLHEGGLPSGEQGMLVVNDAGINRFPLPNYFSTTDNAADSWMRLTLRQDFSTGQWDLYVDGESVPAVVNVSFSGTPTEPTAIYFYGDSGEPVYLDDLQLTAANPLFTDADNDGMSDIWESAHGLSTAANDRDDDPDLDTLTNLEEYLNETSPDDYYNDAVPTLTKVSGDAQTAYPGIWLEEPLVVNAQDSTGTNLENAPIDWSGADGASILGDEKYDESPVVTKQTRTDASGEATVYVKAPDVPEDFTVTATANTETSQAQQSFSVNVVPLRFVYDAEDEDPTDDLINDDAPTTDGSNNVYSGAGAKKLYGNDYIPIDPDKQYRMSGLVRSVGSIDSRTFIGFRCYLKKDDGSYREITSFYVNRTGDSAVIESYDEESGTLNLDSAPEGWNTSGTHLRSIGYYIGGDTTRLPDIIQRGINGAEAYDNITGGILTYAEGVVPPDEVLDALANSDTVVVMNHYAGAGFNYAAASSVYPEQQWTEYKGESITGISWGTAPVSEFRWGTQYVKVALLANYSQTTDAVLEIDDLVFEEVTDYDEDGIPDWWERNILEADAGDSLTELSDVGSTSDYDGDGLSDADEYANGNNPLSPDNISNVNGVYYVNNMRGSDSACNGLSATRGLPSSGDGPFSTLSMALTTAVTDSTVVVYETRNDYDETTLSLSGKDLTLRPSGNVVLK